METSFLSRINKAAFICFWDGENMQKTIAAISTAPGAGAIAIVRMSGDDAVCIADKIFCGKKKLADVKSHTVHYGFIYDGKTKIDEVLVTVMLAPNTYTKENVVEISCHGGSLSARKILSLAVSHGAVYADRGEFTKRAFLNGRMDLCEAEAVAEIINSKTAALHNAAVNQLGGSLSEKINGIRELLLSLSANLDVISDFPEEGLEPLSDTEFYNLLSDIRNKTEKLYLSAKRGRIIKNGIKTVIVGKPNVGKSSLLNLLSGSERAIVTDVEGTTRDVIEEQVDIGGVMLVLYDTAGIRSTDDKVEKIGVEMSKKRVSEAELVIFMLDAQRPADKNDEEILSLINGRKTVYLINKSENGINESVKSFCSGKENVVEFSVKNETGVDKLGEKINDMFNFGEISDTGSETIINERHCEALSSALESINSAINALDMRLPSDMTFVDIENAVRSLGFITGMSVSDEIVDKIFHSFCVGK